MLLPRSTGIMILPRTTLFPHALLPLHIYEPRYRQMLQHALEGSRMFCVAMQRPDSPRREPSEVACLGLIRACVRKPDGTSNLILQGLLRVRLGDQMRLRPYRIHEIEPLAVPPRDAATVNTLCVRVLELATERLKQGFNLPADLLGHFGAGDAGISKEEFESALSKYAQKYGLEFLSKLEDASQLADLVSCALVPGAAERQTILETLDLESRLKSLIGFLAAEIQRNQG